MIFQKVSIRCPKSWGKLDTSLFLYSARSQVEGHNLVPRVSLLPENEVEKKFGFTIFIEYSRKISIATEKNFHVH